MKADALVNKTTMKSRRRGGSRGFWSRVLLKGVKKKRKGRRDTRTEDEPGSGARMKRKTPSPG